MWWHLWSGFWIKLFWRYKSLLCDGVWIGKVFLVIQWNCLLPSSEFYSPRRAARFKVTLWLVVVSLSWCQATCPFILCLRYRSLVWNISQVPVWWESRSATLEVLWSSSVMCMYRFYYSATPRLRTIPLMTSQSYNRNFLKKISFHMTIKLSVKCHLELNYDISLNKPCIYQQKE